MPSTLAIGSIHLSHCMQNCQFLLCSSTFSPSRLRFLLLICWYRCSLFSLCFPRCIVTSAVCFCALEMGNGQRKTNTKNKKVLFSTVLLLRRLGAVRASVAGVIHVGTDCRLCQLPLCLCILDNLSVFWSTITGVVCALFVASGQAPKKRKRPKNSLTYTTPLC